MLEFIHNYALEKKETIYDFRPEWNAGRYFLKSKIFLMAGEYKDKQKIITIKLDTFKSDILRKENLIFPGYHMNKLWWNSCFYEKASPEFLKELIDDSYMLIFNSLSLKLRKEIK